MIKEIRGFRALSVLDISSYEHFKVCIKQALKIISHWRRTRMMETINVMERNYERRQSYRKEKIDGKLRRKDERSPKAKRDEPYLLRYVITITMNEMV